MGAEFEEGAVEARVPARFFKALEASQRAYAAALRDVLAAMRGEFMPGYDGAPPEITTERRPGDNPQLHPPRNIREHPLDLMLAKKQLTMERWSAGDLYRTDVEMAHVSPLRSASYEAIFAGAAGAPGFREIVRERVNARGDIVRESLRGPVTFTPKGVKAVKAWRGTGDLTLMFMGRANAAALAVRGEAGADCLAVLDLVVRDRRKVSDVGSMGRFGARAAVGKKLARALDALARHYGLIVRRAA
ncbi:MAG: hypothetical protein NW215_10685 [Hyphomicrobiales bacterium]|nr:hypothetical protein [Hyphomicrobiales bacterium]